MSAQKKTSWFDGSKNPARVGVYERKFKHNHGVPSFSHWNGTRWGLSAASVKDALRNQEDTSLFQGKPWRGLLQEAK